MSPKRRNSKVAGRKLERPKLNWRDFNLLENLLAFCAVADGCAPPDSGVEFRINSPSSDDLICVLFEIDRGGNDPLVREGIKPDYMAFYADKKTCVCTIIELKGRGDDDLEHGIDQIRRLRDVLREQLQEHLPNKVRSEIKFQGILLSPPNSNPPLLKIKREEKNGFVILPLQYHQKAELFEYVSKAHKSVNVRYQHNPAPHEDGHGFIEGIMIEKVLAHRIEDSFFSINHSPDQNRRGVYLNYKLSSNEYAALKLDNNVAKIAIKGSKDTLFNKIRSGLNELGVTTRSLSLERID